MNVQTRSPISSEEFCERVGLVREWAGLNRAAFSRALGEAESYMSWLEKGNLKTIDAGLAQRVASVAAGRRWLTTDEDLIYAYLLGWEVDTTELLPRMPGNRRSGPNGIWGHSRWAEAA